MTSSGATITVSWQAISVLIAFVVLWSGIFIWALKWVLDRERHFLDERLTRMDESIAQLQTKMTNAIVREDWIRFCLTLTARIDGLPCRSGETAGDPCAY